MFVRRPRGPVAGLAEGDSGHDAAGRHVLAEHDVEIALAGLRAGREVQVRVAADVGEGDELERILAGHGRRNFGEIAAGGIGSGGDADSTVARHVERVVGGESERLPGDFDDGLAAEGDQAGFVGAGGELDCRVAGIEDDAAIMQMADGCVAGGQGAHASFAFVGGAKHTGRGGDGRRDGAHSVTINSHCETV